MSPPPFRALPFRPYTLVAGFACVLFTWCALQQARVGDLAPADRDLAYPARVHGRVVRDEAEARFVAAAVRPGDPVRVEDARGARVLESARAVSVSSLLISLIVSLAFGAACLFAFAGRAGSEPARTFFLGSFGYGLAVATGGVHGASAVRSPEAIASLFRIASMTLTPLLLVRIAQVFPRPTPVRAARLLWPPLFGAGAAVTALQALAYARAVRGDGPLAFARLVAQERVSGLWIVFLVAAGGILLWRKSRVIELARERRQAKWVAWGVCAGVFPFILLYLLPRALGVRELLPLDLLRLCALAVPAAFAIAVVRHQFMDIDVIIRRSLIYATLAALLTAAYLAVGLFLGERFGRHGDPSTEAARLAVAALAIVLFFPTRRAIGEWVDRTFFRLRAGRERAVAEFRQAMRGVIDPDDWARTLAAFVRTALGLRRALVVYADGPAPREAWSVAETGSRAGNPGGEAVAALARLAATAPVLVAAPERTGMPELEQADFPPALLAEGLVAVRPLAGGEGVLGWLALGEKETERRFVEPEIALVEAIAGEASGALERLQLVRRAAEEESRARRQEELDRRKAEFLSQVAHDLQTPLTSILWSSQNLADGIMGPLDGNAAAAVGSIRAAASHMSRLVANLVALARLDEGAFTLRPEPVPMWKALCEAATALDPLARSRDLRIEFDRIDEARDWPAVRCDRDGLMKIAVNLLDNAIKYAPAGSAITLRLARPRAGAQSFAVEDHGPGVPDTHKASVFGRYARGPREPAPRARGGLGLGLYVARSYLERCDGTIAVRDTPGGGATFTCTLREFDPPAQEAPCPRS